MTNKLIHEQSLYLQQHAHNPVQWYPWGNEAFALAKKENKPVIVSIGYAACHWCHVMERESFENEDTAAFMNTHFINIKVDREEYPDVDDFYMTAVQALTGSGGWPLNVFVTPEKLPFYGGTYFPPIPAHGRPSWLQILERMVQVWQQKPDDIAQQANQMFQYLKNAAQTSAQPDVEEWSDDDIKCAAENILKQADKQNGGFGNAPKFPSTMSIQFLLENYHYYGNEDALKHALLSLDKMIDGGIYDQIGGGFSRYAVDNIWLVPHFEKMLYDNAMLVNVLCDAYIITKQQKYREVAEETLSFLLREMKQNNAGFFSAIDADSEGEEGKFYTFTWEELSLLLKDSPRYVFDYLGVSRTGNWEGTNILNCATTIEAIATNGNITKAEVKFSIVQAKKILFTARSSRIRPTTDDKILLSWNALLNTALSKASVAFDCSDYASIAQQNIDWMLTEFEIENSPKHTWKNGKSKITANLDDLAFLLQALIQISMTLNDENYLLKAMKLTAFIFEHFAIENSSLFYYTNKLQNEVPLRKPETYDGVVPSSNAVMSQNLHILGMLGAQSTWIAQSEMMAAEMRKSAIRNPTSFAYWCIIAQRMKNKYKTIVVTGAEIDTVISDLKKKFWPECYYFFEKKENFVTMPFGKQFEKKTQIFICTKNSCLPTLDILPENIDLTIL